MNELLQAILGKLDRGDSPDAKWPDSKGEYWALCPFHPDHHATNFSVSERGYNCFACAAKGSLKDLAATLNISASSVDVLRCCQGGKATFIFSGPISLAAYAEAKKLPLSFLKELGLSERKHRGEPAIVIPYYNQDGQEIATRYRISLAGSDKFRWAKNSKVQLYGLWRLAEAKAAGYVILVEGESDSQTLWHYGLPALGIPGADTWRKEWAAYLEGLTVYLWQEPDGGGEAFAHRIGESLPAARVMVPPAGCKDISEWHLLGGDVPALVQRLMREARPYSELRTEAVHQEAAEARRKAEPLLRADILEEVAKLCRDLGLVGEERNAKLLYLALTSRLLDKPVSAVVKGPSSGGKSFTVETALKLFPPSAYYALSSMSERALAYSQEPLCHRMLVLYEAAGLESEFGTYLLRTLLSEGHIRYETVEKTQDGLAPRLIEREGPTGVILTTTWASLHPENETRMLSLTVRDDPHQTAGVLEKLAARADGRGPQLPDLEPWHALQKWLELAASREVTIPYASTLATLANPKAVRLRRDFSVVLNLIKTHTILHQCQRERDAQGCIVATLADYAAVHDLVIDIISEGAQASVSATIRETVQAVAELSRQGQQPVSVSDIAKKLEVDKAAASRRARVATEQGYLVNMEDRRGKPARLLPGEPLPEEQPVLPSPQTLQEKISGFTPLSTHQHVNSQHTGPHADITANERFYVDLADVEPTPF